MCYGNGYFYDNYKKIEKEGCVSYEDHKPKCEACTYDNLDSCLSSEECSCYGENFFFDSYWDENDYGDIGKKGCISETERLVSCEKVPPSPPPAPPFPPPSFGKGKGGGGPGKGGGFGGPGHIGGGGNASHPGPNASHPLRRASSQPLPRRRGASAPAPAPAPAGLAAGAPAGAYRREPLEKRKHRLIKARD